MAGIDVMLSDQDKEKGPIVRAAALLCVASEAIIESFAFVFSPLLL